MVIQQIRGLVHALYTCVLFGVILSSSISCSKPAEKVTRESPGKSDAARTEASPAIEKTPSADTANIKALPEKPAAADTAAKEKISLIDTAPDTETRGLIVVTDRRCRRPECAGQRLEVALKKKYPNSRLTMLDYSDEKGADIYRQSKQPFLPVSVTDDFGLPNATPTFRFHGNAWDPTQKEVLRRLELVTEPSLETGVRALYEAKLLVDSFDRNPALIDFQVHYVSNTASGADNILDLETEISRRLCIESIYLESYRFIDYLLCRNTSTGGDNWRDCLEDGMDEKEIESCTIGEKGKRLRHASNSQAAVVKSETVPYFIVNGMQHFCPNQGKCSINSAHLRLLYCYLNPDVHSCSDGCDAPVTSLGTQTDDMMPKWVFSKPAGLWVSKSEVTAAQFERLYTRYPSCKFEDYDAVFRDLNHMENASLGAPQMGTHPAYPVNFDDAAHFCRWMGGRLPTAEELTAEATDNRRRTWPWGNEPVTCQRVVTDRDAHGPCAGYGRSEAVCSRPAGNSINGLCDLVGNVEELVTQDSHKDHYTIGEMVYMGEEFGGVQSMADTITIPRYGDMGGFRCVKASSEPTGNGGFHALCKRLHGFLQETPAPEKADILQCDDATAVYQSSTRQLYVSLNPQLVMEDRYSLGIGICRTVENGAFILFSNPVPCYSKGSKTTTQSTVLAYTDEAGIVSYVDIDFHRHLSQYPRGIVPIEIKELTDFDGDGQTDALLLRYNFDSEESSGEWTQLIELRGGKASLARYTPDVFDTRYVIARISDETGDGRKDIVLKRQVFTTMLPSGFSYAEDADVLFLGESLPDGSFGFDTPKAKAFLRKQCPSKPRKFDASYKDTICAKFWGVAVETIVEKIRKNKALHRCDEEAEEGGVCSTDEDAYLDLAMLKVPFEFNGPTL